MLSRKDLKGYEDLILFGFIRTVFRKIFRGRQKAQAKMAKEKDIVKRPAETKPVVSEVKYMKVYNRMAGKKKGKQ